MRVSIAQIHLEDGNKRSNLKRIENAIESAIFEKSDLLVLPELSLTGFANYEDMMEIAEGRNGESLREIIQILNGSDLKVVYSFAEKSSDGSKVYNTTCVVSADYGVEAKYRKIHPFGFEKSTFSSGTELVSFEVKGRKLGILVCFDIEFPEVSRLLAEQHQVEVLVVPSANMKPYGKFHRTYSLSRAMENHNFVIYCNRVGKYEENLYLGESCIISPLGEVIKEGATYTEDFFTVDLDFNKIDESKTDYDYLQEKRFGVEGSIIPS